MATTSRFALHYQTLTDSPDGAAMGALLAADVDTWLCRRYPVADANARLALTSVPAGFSVLQQDDNSEWTWTGLTWQTNTSSTSSGGGGGGGTATPTSIEGQWRASSNQNMANGTDTVLAFGTTETSSEVVTRATSGAGHKFTLANTGAYAVTATVRFASGNTGSRFIELRNSAQSVRYVADGDSGGPSASTRSFSITKRFTAGQELVVIGAQSSGGTLSTQYQGSGITDGFVRLTIVKLSD